MLSLVRTSLVLVSFLLVLHVSEALPLEEWLLSRSKIDDVNNERSRDEQRFDEESFTSLKKFPAEIDQVPDVFADDHSESSLPEIVRRQQCRFGGCGKKRGE
ncbi:hypothetical protein ACROYT_G024142 [Oculina patagonica]